MARSRKSSDEKAQIPEGRSHEGGVQNTPNPLPRGQGDEHGGYVIDAEAEHTIPSEEKRKGKSENGAAGTPAPPRPFATANPGASQRLP